MNGADVAPAPGARVDDAGAWAVFRVFLSLGLTSFGGPIAHLGYFRDAFVVRRRWMSEQRYADLVALCQVLPGPASSQLGMAIGLSRAGLPGALAAWFGFTLPSAVAMVAFAQLSASWRGSRFDAGHGLMLAAVAVVAQAVWSMARAFCVDVPRIALALVAAFCILAWPQTGMQMLAIAAAAAIGAASLRPPAAMAIDAPPTRVSSRLGIAALLAFVALLAALPLCARFTPMLAVVDAFYRSGALVFGGGHVVLPLLHEAVVRPGWVSEADFVIGYGAAQAVPGPLFTFAAYLGAMMAPGARGVVPAVVCLVAIFSPSLLLVVGVMPFWERLRASPRMRAALSGVNAAVVGLLAAALCDPLWPSAIRDWRDMFCVVAGAFVLVRLRWPSWLVVLSLAAVGAWRVEAGAS